MKFAFLSLCVFAVVSTGLISCSNGDYSATPGTVNNGSNPIYQPPAGGSGDGSFKATVGSNTFIATTAYYMDTAIIPGDTVFDIVGSIIDNSNVANSKSITISLTNYKGVGTYNLNPDSSQASVVYLPNGISGGFQSADSGSLVITDVSNGQLTGTFKFATDSVNVTDGTFTKLKKL